MNLFQDEATTRRINVFDWDKEFPDIFKNGGFDVVIGNPPYITYSLGRGRDKPDNSEVLYYVVKWINSCDYKINSFALFYELALKIICIEGVGAYIIPGTILINESLKKIRKYLVNNNFLETYYKLDFKVFKDAEMGDCAILFIKKNLKKSINKIISLYSNSKKEILTPIKSKINIKSIKAISDYRLLPNDMYYNFLIPRDNQIILEKICKFYNGIKTGNNKKFLSDKKISNEHISVVRGRDFSRYSEIKQEKFVLFDKKQLWSNFNEEKLSTNPKILIRQTGDKIIATLDENGYFVMDTVHIIYESNINLWVLLALINSKSFNFLHSLLVPEAGKTFAEIKISNLKKVNIPNLLLSQKNRIGGDLIEMVEQMLEIQKKYNNAKLENEKMMFKKQIDILDNQIDQMVYDLYGLTEEEIKIVEEKR
jgi:hypothetical protein